MGVVAGAWSSRIKAELAAIWWFEPARSHACAQCPKRWRRQVEWWCFLRHRRNCSSRTAVRYPSTETFRHRKAHIIIVHHEMVLPIPPPRPVNFRPSRALVHYVPDRWRCQCTDGDTEGSLTTQVQQKALVWSLGRNLGTSFEALSESEAMGRHSWTPQSPSLSWSWQRVATNRHVMHQTRELPESRLPSSWGHRCLDRQRSTSHEAPEFEGVRGRRRWVGRWNRAGHTGHARPRNGLGHGHRMRTCYVERAEGTDGGWK